MKLVLSGDFFQLPPVELGHKDVGFAFQAQSWNQCISSVTTLSRVFRQKEQCTITLVTSVNGCLPNILAFVELLNEMRFGRLSQQNKSRLTALSREVKYTDSVEPTELYVTTAPPGVRLLDRRFAGSPRRGKFCPQTGAGWPN